MSAAESESSSWTGRDVHPQPIGQEDTSKKNRSFRARLPRSQSTGNMLEAVGASFKSNNQDARNINADMSERGNLQDLAKFFRTTAPPLNHTSETTQGLEHSRKRSFQSFIKRRRNTKLGSQSVQLQPTERFVVKRSIEGYPYTTLPDPEGRIQEEAAASTHYPVFPKAHSRQPSGPPQWPERTSSAGALSPKTPTRASSTEPSHQGMPLIAERSPASAKAESQPGNEDLKNFTEARVLATNFFNTLAAQHNSHGTSGADSDNDLAPDQKAPVINHKGHQSSPLTLVLHKTGHGEPQTSSLEFPATPPPSGQLQQFEWPEVVIKSPGGSPKKSPESLLSRRRQSSLTNLQTMHTSAKARGSPMLPTKLSNQMNLAVPEENLPPESPGFPKMLAGMNFPSPPKTSRPASAASNATLGSLPSTASPPQAVRPRTSSRNATMPLSGTISLNEMMMRSTRPGLLHSQSENTLRDAKSTKGHGRAESVVPKPPSDSGSTGAAPTPILPPSENNLSVTDAVHVRSDSDVSYVTACDEQRASGTASTFSDYASYRQSGSSIMTTTTESHRRSTSTNLTNRQSTRSNATTVSTTPSFEDGTGKFEDPAISNIENNPHWPLPIDAHGDMPRRRASTKTSTLSERPIEATTTTPTFDHYDSPKPMSLAERRIARHRPSTGHSDKLIDHAHLASRPNLRSATSFDSVDSPVLGYFPYSVPSRKASVHGPSPLAHISPLVAVTQGSDSEAPSISSSQQENPAVAPVTLTEQSHAAPATVKGARKDSRAKSSISTKNTNDMARWSVSSVMATEIQPSEDPEETDDQDLSVSPLMIVAEVFPEVVEEAQLSGQRISTVYTGGAPTVPHLPPKSPRRPKHASKRLSRQIPLPVRVNIPTADASGTISNSSNVIGRGGPPLPPPGVTSRAQKRMSLPIYMMSNDRPVSWLPPSRLRESSAAYGQEQRPDLEFNTKHELESQPEEDETETETETEPETRPRRRSSIIKERIHLAKLARENEIAELVAKMAKPAPLESHDPHEDMSDSSESQACTTDELERRIQRLEKDNGEWVSMLDPLLSNMTRTLKEMKQGKLNPLLMNEFIVDMACEARRSMAGGPQESEGGLRSPVNFEGFDGAHEPSQAQPGSRPATAVRVKKTSFDHNLPQNGHVRISTEEPTEPKVEEPATTLPGGLTEIKVPPPITDPADAGAASPRTPQQHLFEADRAIRKRILAQEVMMDELMSKWGLPSPRPSVDSMRSTAMTLPPPADTSSKRHSKSSSVATLRPSHRQTADSDVLGISAGAGADQAPINKRLLMDSEGLGGPAGSKRGSRRWSSAGERMSWKPGDTGFMNVLMQELRSTSRLSLESGGDYEVWI